MAPAEDTTILRASKPLSLGVYRMQHIAIYVSLFALDPTGAGRLPGLTEGAEAAPKVEQPSSTGDGGGQSISYEKGRGVPEDQGELKRAM